MRNTKSILQNYYFEKNKYDLTNSNNKDVMWDVFDINFEQIITKEINNFRRNGLTCGIEIGLLQSDRQNIINKKILPQIYDEEYSKTLIKRFKNLKKMINNDEFILSNIECNIGNPQYCIFDNIKLNTNDLYSIYDTWQITRFFNSYNEKIILEIGGGFGGLANKIINNFKNCKYISIDLPETLILQHFYLSELYPDKKILRYNDIINCENVIEFDILLLPPFELDVLNTFKFDLIIQTRGFSEMKHDIIKKYFEIIHKNIKDDGILFLGCERYVTYRGEKIVRIRDYPFDDNWNIIISQPSWLATHGHDFLLKRTCSPIFKFTEIIKSFPLISPPPGPITYNYNLNKWIENNKMVDDDIL